jgi:large subunit ribosomal protein L25
MSATKLELIATNREAIGKLACRRLRSKENQVPAVIYGGKQSNSLISLDHNHLLKFTSNENFYSTILHLNIDGQKQKVLLKDLQRHPFKPKILHLDFQRVTESDVITMQVPLHFTNEDTCPGAKSGGLVMRHANAIEIRCKAKYLPEFIEVDLSNVQLGEILHLSHLKLPANVEIPALSQEGKLDAPVVGVQLPKAVVEVEATTEESAEASNENKDNKAESDSKNQKSDQK